MNEMHYQMDLLKAMNQKLTAKERMYQMICDSTRCAYLYLSFEKNEIATMGRWQDIFSFDVKETKDIPKILDEVEESYAMSLRDILFLEKSGHGISAMECKSKSGNEWYSFRATVNYDNAGVPLDKLIVVENTTIQKKQRDELEYMAHFDNITGLFNRNYFVVLLGNFLRRAEANKCKVSVMVIDIDDFKKVNDGMGMVIGDELIQSVGIFLKSFADDNVHVCHLSNDVYCIAIYNPSGDCTVEGIYKAIQERVKSPFVMSGGQEATITLSIGVAEYPEAATTTLDLINSAEIVMFRCKTMGKNSLMYFDAHILNEFLNNIEMENKLKDAVFNSNFELHYQPQYYTDSKKLRGMEALIRWKDDDGHMIRPDIFIPIAEKNGCILPMGDWVVEQSIRQYCEWRKQYDLPLILSINISAVQYGSDDFADSFLKVVERYAVNPKEIEIEITESVLIDDFDTVYEKLRILREHGIRVSLDDFGTGFSSLSYLKKFPIDTLKIDKSFIDTVLTDSTTRVITESIVNMVKSLGIESVAEGVEEEEQYQYLHTIGCDIIQGFLFAKPLPSKEFEKLLQKSL